MCGMYHIGREMAGSVDGIIRMVSRERKAGTETSQWRNPSQGSECQQWRIPSQESECQHERIPSQGSECQHERIPGLEEFFEERDVRPTELAPVISGSNEGPALRNFRWGLPGFQKGQVIFNARCETAMEKSIFREGVLHNRIVIPALSFYEWNQRKEKNVFTRQDGGVIYMAGFCAGTGEDERFAILTTEANVSMAPVHDRMPLILEESEIEPWLYREDWTESLLRKMPKMLSRKAEYEQLSLFEIYGS